MVPRKTWFSENVGPISKLGSVRDVSPSKYRFRVILCLGGSRSRSRIFNQGLAVSQSLEFSNLYPGTVSVQISIF